MTFWDGRLRSSKRPAEDSPTFPVLRQRIGTSDSWAMVLRPRAQPPAPVTNKFKVNTKRRKTIAKRNSRKPRPKRVKPAPTTQTTTRSERVERRAMAKESALEAKRASELEAERVKAELVEAERVKAERVEAERIEAERVEEHTVSLKVERGLMMGPPA